MAYTEKDWKDSPLTTTPLSAAAMEDLEMRTTDYVATYAQGVNVWESEANPASVTDWGPVINALIAAGETRFYFNENNFPFSTALVFTTLAGAGATFEGAHYNDSKLIWEGTGSICPLNFSSGGANCYFSNISIQYSSASFTGDLMILGGTGGASGGGHHFDNFQIGSTSPVTIKSARCLVNLDDALWCFFRGGVLWGAQQLIRGYDTTAATFSNSNSFRDLVLDCYTDIAICNPGYNWTLDGICWEMGSGGSNTVGIGGDLATTAQPAFFTLHGESAFWDAADASVRAIQQPVGHEWHVTIRDTTFHNSGRTYSDIDLQGTGSVLIERCGLWSATPSAAQIDLGDVVANGSGSRKDNIRVSGCYGYPYVTNIEGHGQVQIENMGATGGPQLTTLGGYERISTRSIPQDAPTATVHSGYSAPSGFISAINGTDGAGMIYFDTANGVAPAGLAVDVTFETPVVPAYRASGGAWLGVSLTPMAAGTAGDWPDGDAIAAANPYVQVPNPGAYTVAGTATGFTIGLGSQIAQGEKFALFYRVTQL